jgi:hypothetical protein
MTSQLLFQNFEFVAGTTSVGLGLIALRGKLEGIACPLNRVLGLAAKAMPQLLPCLVHTACHVAQTYALGHIPFCSLALESLRWVLPALHVIAAAI